jgi:hypothetical protein
MAKAYVSGFLNIKQAGRPDQGLPGVPGGDGGLGIWGPTDPFPTPPIYIPITPPPESGLSPEHPIYIPVYPDIGFPADQPHPDQGLPGDQPHPDQGLPGDQPYPDNTLPPHIDNSLPDGGKAAIIAAIKKAVDFWTGNLPPPSGGPTPTPVKKK